MNASVPPTRRLRRGLSSLATGLAIALLGTAAVPSSAESPDRQAVAVVETTPSNDSGDSVDDMAIWVNTADPAHSLVIGADHSDKTLDVYDMSGNRTQSVQLNDANNVDLRTGFPLGGSKVDIVGVAGGGSGDGRLTFFRVDPQTRRIENVTVGGHYSVPSANGFCMYRSAVSGKYYAFRTTPSGIVQQYELFDDGGMVNARPAGEAFDVEVQEIDPGSLDAIEACVADDETGSLYIGEQDYGIWKYGAEPTAPRTKADRSLVDGAHDRTNGHLTPDVEGLAIVHEPGGGGFLLASSQGDFTFNVYRRRAPHEFVGKVSVVAGPLSDGCQRTDGIDAVAATLGPRFPRGIFVCQDNTNTAPAPGNMNFKYVPLEDVVPLGDVVPLPDPPPDPQPDPDPKPEPEPEPDPGAHPSATPNGTGYWMLGSDGTVYAFGDATHHGDARGLAGPAVDLEATPTGKGYWVVDRTGFVRGFGDVPALGGLAAGWLAEGEEATSLSVTPSGAGYWIFTNLGRVMAFGDAPVLGDMSGTPLNGPVLDSIATPSGLGYYMVASDGGIFSFGDARFFGSMGATPLNAPVQSLVPDPDSRGYWLVASDGGVFSFEAGFRGSMGDRRLNAPMTGMVAFGDGYLMVATDGGIFNFSDQPFSGSLGANPPAHPITSVAALR